MNEADSCRELVRLNLETAGWDNASKHFHSELINFTNGRIVTPGGTPKGFKKKIVDFLLQ